MLTRVLLSAAALALAAVPSRAEQTAPPTPSAQVNPAPAAGSTPPVSAPTGPGPNEFVFSQVHVNGPYIAMTFDDGPHATLTPKLLDILKERNIKVTFFLIGKNAAEYPDIVKRIVAEGHEVANHSWSHPDLAKLPQDTMRSEISRTQDAIVNATGKPVTMLRPPYGALNPSQRQYVHDTYGYRIILWDVDPLDWRRPGPAIVSERILKGVKPGSIILSHDIHPGTIEAMPATLDALLARGFQFVTVSELIKLETPVPAAPGKATKAAATGTTNSAASAPAAAPTPNPYDAVLRAEPKLSPAEAAAIRAAAVPTPSPTPPKKKSQN